MTDTFTVSSPEYTAYWAELDRRSASLAEAVRKSDARIMAVERHSQMGWTHNVVMFRAIVYSDLHKREAEIEAGITAEFILDDWPGRAAWIADQVLDEFEWLEENTVQ